RPDPADPGRFDATVVVDWEAYAYLIYAMARAEQLEKLSEVVPVPGMHVNRYRVGKTTVTLIFFDHPPGAGARDRLLAELRESVGHRARVFVPYERVQSGL